LACRERGKRKEERGKRKEERGKRKEERGYDGLKSESVFTFPLFSFLFPLISLPPTTTFTDLD